MKFTVTLGEIGSNDNISWKAFCDMFGWDYYCLHEGCDPKTEQEMTLEQAKELGFIQCLI